jgi:hypothetical protein
MMMMMRRRRRTMMMMMMVVVVVMMMMMTIFSAKWFDSDEVKLSFCLIKHYALDTCRGVV